MTVADLIAKLQTMPMDAVVVVCPLGSTYYTANDLNVELAEDGKYEDTESGETIAFSRAVVIG